MSMINFTIDGRKVSAKKGESILQVARREGVYIPTMCYLSKANPNASCRMCVVEVEGVEGFVLSCNTPPVEGAVITTDSGELYKHRQNIMKLYNVNHPLQCGVCDKSGECDLQNKTLEFGLDEQSFSAQEHKRKNKKWNVLSYDPYLCIMCEKCVTVCNEVVGSEALYIKTGGYNSEIDNMYSKCIQCGECISVCPVGAMSSSDFKYSANAWELKKIPSSCAHCSSACNLNYEVKHTQIGSSVTDKSIYRVTNESDFDSLCGAGRFGYDFENRVESCDEVAFTKVVEAFRVSDTIKFSSMITNEEALILQRLKSKYGYKLINEDARKFREFMNAYSSVSGRTLYSGTLDDVKNSDYIFTIGSSVSNDNPMVRFALSSVVKNKKAYVAYMHPIEDEKFKNVVSQFIKYEVGSEEGLLGMLCATFLSSESKAKYSSFFDAIDMGYLGGESNVNEQELELLKSKIARKKAPMIIVGADLISHDRAKNIAKLVALLELECGFKILIIPTDTNTLGVSLICDLDSQSGKKSIGYNVKGDVTLSALGDGDLDMPSLNQQEGTFTNIDKKVVPLNAAIAYKGYELNDIAKCLGLVNEHVINYTKELPLSSGYQNREFDELPNYYTNSGEIHRGYDLVCMEIDSVVELENIADLSEFNGSVIYNVNPISQFNRFSAKAHQIKEKSLLVGSEQFAIAAKIKSGDVVTFEFNNRVIKREFKMNSHLKGTIAHHSVFDLDSSDVYGTYRFEKVKIQKEGN